MTTRTPAVGTLMKDLDRDKFGYFQALIDGDYWLRPVGGGHEWNVRPADTRQATYAEAQRARKDVERLRERAARMQAQGAQ